MQCTSNECYSSLHLLAAASLHPHPAHHRPLIIRAAPAKIKINLSQLLASSGLQQGGDGNELSMEIYDGEQQIVSYGPVLHSIINYSTVLSHRQKYEI